MTLLLVYVGGALSVSFLCSILEAALLSVRPIELAERRDAGDAAAAALLDIKEKRIDDAISAILTLNTIANTLGATLAGAQAARVFGAAWIGVFSGFLTLAVLIAAEIIPKTLGAIYAKRLVGFVAPTMRVMMTALKPVLFLTGLLTRLLGRPKKHRLSRGELMAVVGLARKEGTLAKYEERVLGNILRFDEILIEDVMTPRTVIAMLPVTATMDDLLADPALQEFSRIPLFDESPDQMAGYVHQRVALGAFAHGRDGSTPLREFQRNVLHLPETTSLGRAMRVFLVRREHFAVVIDEFGGTSGIVTLEDVLETVLGTEIVDELDSVADLRGLAARRRDRRLTNQGLTDESSPGAAE
jgi:CBS domain containing-hemolysin-like protein